VNDLKTTHPTLAEQALGWDPSTITYSFSKKKTWLCPTGHQWEAPPNKRWSKATDSPTPCPECLNRGRSTSKLSLSDANPAIASEAFGWNPDDYGEKSSKSLTWKCSIGHEYQSSIAKRLRGDGCPYCSNRRVIKGFNDLQTIFPDVASEAHNWDPRTVTARSHKKVEWICSEKHTWEQKIYVRTVQGSGCPTCANLIILPGFNDLKTLFPEIAEEAYGWDPSKVGAGSTKKLEWKCKNGHIISKTPDSRVQARNSASRGCGYCSGKIVELGLTDLKTKYPKIASEALGWNPSNFSPGSGSKQEWKCQRGHVYERRIRERVAGQACPFCSNHKLLPGFNDMATTNPILAREAFGWDPTTVFESGKNPLKWKCKSGHVWELPPNGRRNHRTGQISQCPYCSNQKVLVGFNDFGTLQPDLTKQMVDCDPFSVVEKSNKIVKWIDEKGHEWKTTPANRVKGIGCPTCAKTGFDPNKDAFLYLLNHPNWELYKIGISNSSDQRTNKHQRSGWELLEVRGPMEGMLAYEWEQSILLMLSANGAIVGLDNIAGKFDGYTEAWTRQSFPCTSIRELMLKVEDQE